MANFWVTGGEYATTDFRELAKGAKPQRYGPFKNYEEAKAAWVAHSWANVDNCHVRFTITRDDQAKSSSAAA
jgi:hypothetical protein